MSAIGCGNGPSVADEGHGSSADSSFATLVENENRPAEVWLDVDPAIGLPEAEVDDGVMMLQVFHSPELKARGVSVVFGNTSLDNGLPIARDVVRRFGPTGIEVVPGAASAAELGQESEATQAIAAALEERPMHLLAVGPVTNVASLLRLRPDLASRIESIVMVAARRVGQSFRVSPESTVPPFRDFNFELDVPAMQVILESAVPLVFAPWEVSSSVWITDDDLSSIGRRSDSGRWVQEQVASWIEMWKNNLGAIGFNPFDTLAAGWLTHPHLIASELVGVWIADDADDIHQGVTKPFLYVDPERRAGRQAIYTYRPDPEFKRVLLERLVARASGGAGKPGSSR